MSDMAIPQQRAPGPIQLSRYHYAPLCDPHQQIRLLQLHPAPDDDTVSCTVHVFDLEKVPEYHAISYTWGNPKDPAVIALDGVLIYVNQNCQYALWQARHFGTVYARIDSVCINQYDLQEKGVQVSIIYDVYHTATQVLMCVGPAFEGIELLQRAADDIQRCPPPGSNYESSWTSWLKAQDEAQKTAILQALDTLSRRPYFERLWVAQEIVAAQYATVICNKSHMPWEAAGKLSIGLGHIGHIARHLKSDFSSEVKNLREMYKATVDNKSAIKPTSYLKHFHWANQLLCEDPRDRVYGTLRLFNWDSLGLVSPRPDYTKSAVAIALELARILYPSCYELESHSAAVKALRIHRNDLQAYDSSVSAGEAITSDGDRPRRWAGSVEPIGILSSIDLRSFICKGIPHALAQNKVPHAAGGRTAGDAITQRSRDQDRFHVTDIEAELYAENGEFIGFTCSDAAEGDIVIERNLPGPRQEIVLRRGTTRHKYQVVGHAQNLYGETWAGEYRLAKIEVYMTYLDVLRLYADQSGVPSQSRLHLQIPQVGSTVRDISERPWHKSMEKWAERLLEGPQNGDQ